MGIAKKESLNRAASGGSASERVLATWIEVLPRTRRIVRHGLALRQ
jgi:hypothetical protein